MRSDLIGKPEEKREYPWLGIYRSEAESKEFTGTVVLFRQENVGFVVHSPNGRRELGAGSISWNMDHFEALRGDIILSN